MAKSSIYIRGLDELERQTNKVLKEMTKGKSDLLLKQARIVRDRVKQKAPRGPTGNLKRAAYATVLPETTTTRTVAFAGIRPRRAPHAHLVEYGHGGPHPAPPHPFFRPAWDEVRGEVRENIRKGLGKTIEGAL